MTSTRPTVELTYEGAPVSARPFFCPGRGVRLASAIAARIGSARQRVLVCSPVLTSGPILGALADLVQRGVVPLTGVVDGTQMRDVLRQWQQQASWKPEAFRHVAAGFARKRSTPWPAYPHDYLHAKLVVADDWAFLGSFNYSRSGEENAENVLMLQGAAVADRIAAFIEQVASRYAVAEGEAGW